MGEARPELGSSIYGGYMEKLLKVHLVFPSIEKRMIEEIKKYCRVTGWNTTLEGASNWAVKGGENDPDLFLINCAVFFVRDQRQASSKFLNYLQLMRKNRSASRIVLLMPERLTYDLDLIVKLLKMQIYDFWFIDQFDEDDLSEFILTARTPEEAEKYLNEKETIKLSQPVNGVLGRIIGKETPISGPKGNQLYKPYFLKTSVLAFSTEDDTLVNNAAAILTAYSLAEKGLKVGLVETISHLPQLAGCLSVFHPYFNTCHAISMYTQGNSDFIKHCLINPSKYYEDKNTVAVNTSFKNYPECFYVLPDGKRDDNIAGKEMESGWEQFILGLIKNYLFEKGFNYLIFLCNGKSFFNDMVIAQYANMCFYTTNMLPCSLSFALEQCKERNLHIIGTHRIKDAVKDLNQNQSKILFAPASLYGEFSNFVYSGKYKFIGEESRFFIEEIVRLLGIQIPTGIKENGFNRGLEKIRRFIFKN